MTEGTKMGIHEAILAMAYEKGHTWDTTRAAHEFADMVYKQYKSSGQQTNLSWNPLARDMAEMMVKLDPEVSAHQREEMEAAGSVA